MIDKITSAVSTLLSVAIMAVFVFLAITFIAWLVSVAFDFWAALLAG